MHSKFTADRARQPRAKTFPLIKIGPQLQLQCNLYTTVTAKYQNLDAYDSDWNVKNKEPILRQFIVLDGGKIRNTHPFPLANLKYGALRND